MNPYIPRGYVTSAHAVDRGFGTRHPDGCHGNEKTSQTAPNENREAEMSWLPNAPVSLIYLHDRIGKRNDREVLCRLLRDPRMCRAWTEIDQRIKARDKPSHETYQRLFGVINRSLLEANRHSRHREKGGHSYDAENKKKYGRIARDASQLAKDLRDGPFDLCAHKFYAHNVVELARDANSRGPQPGPSKQDDLNQRLDLEWTTLPELLDELARRALAFSAKPPVVSKWTCEFRSNYFIREMARYFRCLFGGTMDATLAAIANVALNRVDDPLTDEDVKRALRHEGGDKGAK